MRSTVVARSTANLGVGGVFREAPFKVGRDDAPRVQHDTSALISGCVNSPQAGTLDIYQCATLADAMAITDVLPAAGASNGLLRLDTFAHPAGAANAGTPVAVVRVFPWVVVRFTNGAVVQTGFRLHIEAQE